MGQSNGNGGPKRRGVAEELPNLLSRMFRIPTIDLEGYEVAPEILALVPRALCEELVALPVSRQGRSLIVAVSDPSDRLPITVLSEHTGYTIEPVIASADAIRAAIRKYYGA